MWHPVEQLSPAGKERESRDRKALEDLFSLILARCSLCFYIVVFIVFSKNEYCSDVESCLFWRTFRLNMLSSRKPCRLAREVEQYNAMEFDACSFVQSQMGRVEVRFKKDNAF